MARMGESPLSHDDDVNGDTQGKEGRGEMEG